MNSTLNGAGGAVLEDDRSSVESGGQAFARLLGYQSGHPLWNCRLLQACRAGWLTKEDFEQIFGQYYLYSRNFSRCLAALMTNCENDYYRAKLSRNVWEEGGGAEPDKRHSEIFRRFLMEGLGIDLEAIRFQGFARDFAHRYLDFCRGSSALAGAAFLSVGTEAVVPRLYGDFCKGLLKAGIDERYLYFFRIHMECDDEHAATLAELMISFSDQPGWFEQCRQAVDEALSIRLQFFDDLVNFACANRLHGLLERVRTDDSLLSPSDSVNKLLLSSVSDGAALSPLYSNTVEGCGIEFSVSRVDFGAEVLDVRIVDIPPFRTNENHRHAHESLISVVKGRGRVLVGGHAIPVQAGDSVFAPRWTMHQTQNTADEPMQLVVVTDYGLTRKASLGTHFQTLRMNVAKDADAQKMDRTD